MNNEQLQDWLTQLNEQWKNGDKKLDHWRKALVELSPNTHVLANYIACNFEDVRLTQPIVAQLLALYYRLGIARCFVLQLLPTFINAYLISLSKRGRNCAEVFEMFFLAIYNEEILAEGTGSSSMVKKVEEIRIPSVRYPSIYHDPAKLNALPPEVVQLKFNNSKACVQLRRMRVENHLHIRHIMLYHFDKGWRAAQSFRDIVELFGEEAISQSQVERFESLIIKVRWATSSFLILQACVTGLETLEPSLHLTLTDRLFAKEFDNIAKRLRCPPSFLEVVEHDMANVKNTVRVGPYPAVERIIAENRYLILTRIIRAVNTSLSHMSVQVVCKYMCMSLINICRSGFSFSESNFRQRILGKYASDEVFGDFAKKQRIPVSPHFLIESFNGINFSLFNGHADGALRALDALHQRAQYEMLPDVLLETNALRNSLLDPQTLKMLIDSEKIS